MVAGDFVRTGGMDAANYALASYLARSGRPVHLVAHRAEPALAALAGVVVHRVRRPLGAHSLGFPLLDRAGARVASTLAAERPVVLGNGGNCRAASAVWLHYVHAAYIPPVVGQPLRRLVATAVRRAALRDERRATRRARVVVANSAVTAEHAAALLGACAERVGVVHYGADAERFRPPSAAERGAARRALGWSDDRPSIAFVGALGDRRKGFDTVFAAWRQLAGEGDPPRLTVAGAGGELAAWRHRVEDAGLTGRVELLGFQEDVRRLLWAADALVAPSRYEAYGLAVQEAMQCGLPALVSRGAGVAERVPPALAPLLLDDPDDPAELATRVRRWAGGRERFRRAAEDASTLLRGWSWDDMGAAMVDRIEEAV
jgi:glycosyltransferase involved in cell wall biosynthesis